MSATVGNEWWKQRSTHGRDLIFTSPTLLWESACEYFAYTDIRKWTKDDWVGKDAIPVERKTDTPYTITGLYIFMDIGRNTWYEYKKREDFKEVISRIEDIIYTQKFEGAAVGAYNANIIARDLGLVDKKDLVVAEKIKFKVGYKKPDTGD